MRLSKLGWTEISIQKWQQNSKAILKYHSTSNIGLKLELINRLFSFMQCYIKWKIKKLGANSKLQQYEKRNKTCE